LEHIIQLPLVEVGVDVVQIGIQHDLYCIITSIYSMVSKSTHFETYFLLFLDSTMPMMSKASRDFDSVCVLNSLV